MQQVFSLDRLVFENSRRYRLGYKIIYSFLAVGGVYIVLAAAYTGHPWYSLGFLIFFGVGTWFGVWKTHQVADQIFVSDDQIEAWNYGGKKIQLRWDQIKALRQFKVSRGPRLLKVVRLISLDCHQQIVFTDDISEFEKLMTLIRAKVPNLRTGDKLTFWERLLVWFG